MKDKPYLPKLYADFLQFHRIEKTVSFLKAYVAVALDYQFC